MLNHEESVLHYKMYKAKKHWLFAGLGVLMMSGALMMDGSTTARAETASVPVTSQTQTTSQAGNAAAVAKETEKVTPNPTLTPQESQALNDYNTYKDGGYKEATDQLATAKTTADANKQQFNTDQDAYQNQLNQYQTDVNTKAPDYQTSNQATENTLDDEYNKVKNAQNDLNTLKDNTNNQIGDANAAANQAQKQLDKLYNALPDNIKNAGKTIENYNKTTTEEAQQLVTGSTVAAYAAALKAQKSGIVNTINYVKDSSSKVTTAKILLPSQIAADGTVSADLYGKTYNDQNGDHQVTYEDDVLPVVLADLQSDTDKVTQNQTDLAGSYSEVVALFNYMKQVADTALPTTSTDGSGGRIQSGQANDTSYQLMHNGSPMASGFGSTYATELLNSIEATKAQMETVMKDIYDSTDNTFDEAGFTAAYDQTLKDQALQIYSSQTDELLKVANKLLTAFQAADNSGDVLWATSPSAGVKTNTLTSTLKTAIDTATQQITTGKEALNKLAPSDHFLSIAYSAGDAANGFTQTINSIWKGLYDTMDKFGMSMSPLMKFDVAQADTAATKDTAGNEIYTPQFIKDHATVFNAATTLADTITQLMQQSSVISNDYEKVLNQLLTINGNYDLVKPEVTYITPLTNVVESPQPVKLVTANTGGGVPTVAPSGDPTVAPGGGETPVETPENGDGLPTDSGTLTTDVGRDSNNEGTAPETNQTSGEKQTTEEGQATDGKNTTKVAKGGSFVTTESKTDTQQEAVTSSRLPQTNETNETAAASLGVLMFSMLLGALGLKKRKRD